MQLGFEVTVDDLFNVLRNFRVNTSNIDVDEIFDELDLFKVEEAALAVDVSDSDDVTLNSQTDSAYMEIAKQLFELGILDKQTIKKYGGSQLLMLIE